MGLFANDMPAADAVALVEELPLKVLQLNLLREKTRRETVEKSQIINERHVLYAHRVIEHTNFSIPLLENAIKAREGDVESQQWLDSLKPIQVPVNEETLGTFDHIDPAFSDPRKHILAESREIVRSFCDQSADRSNG